MEKNQRKIGAVLSYVSIIVTTLIQLLYTPLLIDKLGQSEYGLYSLINSVIGYLTVLDLGFGNAIVVYTSKYRAQGKVEEEKKLHGMFFVIFCIIGLITCLGGFGLYLSVDKLFGSTMTSIELHRAKIMMLILTFNLAITFIFNIYSCIINAYEKFVYQKLISILNTILKPIIMIPLLFMGFKSIAMVVVITIVNLIVMLSNYFYCRNKLGIKVKYSGFDKSLFKTILGYSIWIFLGVIVDKINWSVDQFVLGAVSGTIAVSLYSTASTLNTLFINLSTAVSGVLLPKMSKMVATNASSEALTNEFIKVGRIQHYIVFLMASGLILVGKEFFIVWVGKEFIKSYYVALLLILPLCVPLIQNLGISIRQAMNKHKFASIINVVVAILNIFISIPLAKRFGAIGAAAGTCIGIGFSSIIMNIYYYKYIHLNIPKFWLNILKISIPFAIPWGVVLILKYFSNFTGIFSIVLYGGIFTIIYCLVAYALCMNEYEKNIINNVLKKFKIKGER